MIDLFTITNDKQKNKIPSKQPNRQSHCRCPGRPCPLFFPFVANPSLSSLLQGHRAHIHEKDYIPFLFRNLCYCKSRFLETQKAKEKHGIPGALGESWLARKRWHFWACHLLIPGSLCGVASQGYLIHSVLLLRCLLFSMLITLQGCSVLG